MTLPFVQVNPINKGHVLTQTNQHVKYENSALNSSQGKEWKPCLQ